MSRQISSRLALFLTFGVSVLAAWVMIGIVTSSIASSTRPSSYNDFVSVDTFPTVEDAIQSGQYIYFPRRDYTLNNPVVINRTTSLFMHGSDRVFTRIIPSDPSQPLFIVQEATLINIAGLEFWSGGTALNSRAFLIQNSTPMEFEMLDSFIKSSSLEIKGPGSFRLQGTVIQSRGQVTSPVVIDHPQADFHMIGGNISNFPSLSQLPEVDLFHIWQKQGRFRIYGTGVQWAMGPADFRIDSASQTGPHVIANVRSEGSNGPNRLDFPAGLLYVPPSADLVDVLLMNNSGSFEPSGNGSSHFVDYNAAGTVWLLGNNSLLGAGRLAIGNAPAAAIVALGNRLFNNADILPITAGTKIFAGTTYSYFHLTLDPTEPASRFVNPGLDLTAYPSIPAIPEVTVPLPLDRPPVLAPLPGMLSAATYGAVGDGTTDDTAALQAWLDAGTVLFLPPGTYRTTQPLGYNHSLYGSIVHPIGGWIAGAGSSQTTIVRDAADKGSVFLTEGTAYFTFQGITFQTAAYDPGEPSPIDEPNVALENDPAVGQATQEINFHDVHFIGGKYALGVGLESGTQCSENMFIHSSFRDAKYGLGIGSFNALANIAYGSDFRNNEITMGHGEEGLSGGTWAVLHCTVTGTQDRDLRLINSSSSVWYFHGLSSDSGEIFSHAGTGATFKILCSLSEPAVA